MRTTKLYAFYTEKKRLFEEKNEPIGGGAPPPAPPLKSATAEQLKPI